MPGLRETFFLPEASQVLLPCLFLCFQKEGGAGMSETSYLRYLSAVAQGRVMMKNGLITYREFLLFEEMMCEKYNVPKGSIFRDNDLLYRG